jgi:broad specificity phosphatase PhoE
MSKIILIRHGQASYGAANYDNLSDKGIEQSKALGEYFVKQKIKLDKIYVGKLKRHLQTYEAFSSTFADNKIQLPKPVFLQEFNEHHGNETLKLAFDDFIKQYAHAKILADEIKENPKQQRRNSLLIFEMFFKEFTSGRFTFEHESVQSWVDFRIQTKKGIEIIKKEIASSETVGVFTSGGTKSSIIGDVLGVNEEQIANFNLVMKNTSFSQMLFSKNNLNLLTLNETPHLTDELITFI